MQPRFDPLLPLPLYLPTLLEIKTFSCFELNEAKFIIHTATTTLHLTSIASPLLLTLSTCGTKEELYRNSSCGRANSKVLSETPQLLNLVGC